MSDKTEIEWTDETPMFDRERSRVRYYKRSDPTRPGQQLRRQMAIIGLKWCRGCADWLQSTRVRKQGVCRECANAEYRRSYARDGRAIKARVHARKRGIAPVPVIAQDILTEWFEGSCVYCTAPANTWDHIIPISKGGETVPANIAPACVSCNSSKKDSDVLDWCEATGRDPHRVLEILILNEVA